MSSEILIDPDTGYVRVEATTLRAGSTKDDVARELAPYLNGSRDHRNGYEWLYFRQLTFGGEPAALSACFHLGALSELHWNLDTGGAWPTQEESDNELQFMRKTLARLFSRSFVTGQERFRWGQVWSVYDAKGGFASSGLRYAA